MEAPTQRPSPGPLPTPPRHRAPLSLLTSTLILAGLATICVLAPPPLPTAVFGPSSRPSDLRPTGMIPLPDPTEPRPGRGTAVSLRSLAELASRLRLDADPALLRSPVPRLAPSPPRPAVADEPATPAPVPAATPRHPEPEIEPAPRRVRIGDAGGQVQIGRQYGPESERLVLLPDGQIVGANRLVYTDEPFAPVTATALRESLQAGELRDFRCEQTAHYLVFSQGSPEFAAASARLLESLYAGLVERFRGMGFDVHEAEFPLVAIIYRTEKEFRARRPIQPEIQAYFEILSNRIVFFEHRDVPADEAHLAALRQPATVAHEGTHQVLQNIGVQPRLAPWPLWLVEGLAELAAGHETTPEGGWRGFPDVQSLHLATIHDLDDSLGLQARGARATRAQVGRDRAAGSTVEYLLTRPDLTPTDYALAWALTNYLAKKRTEDFVAYLKQMSLLEPLSQRTAEEQVEGFAAIFGREFPRLDRAVRKHLSAMRYDPPPYYAVVFEQALPDGRLRVGTVVSQSPMFIREWLDRVADPTIPQYAWHALPFRNKSQAVQYAEGWMASH